MPNICRNDVSIVSSEKGIREELWGMIRNLEKLEDVEGSGLTSGSSIEALAEWFCDAVRDSPVYLVALASCSRPMSDGSSAFVMNFAPNVWVARIAFATAWGPAILMREDIKHTDEPTIVGNRWNAEDGTEYGHWEYDSFGWNISSEEDESLAYFPSSEDMQYGGSDCFAAGYCRLMGQAIPPNKIILNRLAKEDNGDAIFAWNGSPSVCALCDQVNLAALFKSGCYSAYEAILRMSSVGYRPNKMEMYFDEFLDNDRHTALEAFITRYDWDKRSVRRARNYFQGRGDSAQAIALLDAEIQKRQMVELQS